MFNTRREKAIQEFLRVRENHLDADHNTRMRARTLGYRIMVVGPLLLVGSIAFDARMFVDTFDIPANTKLQQEAILAYREPVVAAEKLRVRPPGGFDREHVHDVANIWLNGAESGALKPLAPAFYEDSIRDGVKSQIKAASDSVVTTLNSLARKNIAEENYSAAAEDLLAAIKVAEILKYSDAFSVTLCAIQQRTSLNILSKVEPHLQGAERKLILSDLKKLRDSQHPLEEVVRVNRRLYALALERKGARPLGIEEPGRLMVVSYKGDPLSPSALVSMIQNPALASRSGHVPPFVPELRMCWQSQHQLEKVLDGFLLALERPANSRTRL